MLPLPRRRGKLLLCKTEFHLICDVCRVHNLPFFTTTLRMLVGQRLSNQKNKLKNFSRGLLRLKHLKMNVLQLRPAGPRAQKRKIRARLKPTFGRFRICGKICGKWRKQPDV
jgi:hypothetical protein